MHIRVLALLIPPWIVNSKKSKKIWWRRTTNVLSDCQVSSWNNIRGCRGKKNNQHSKIDYFLPRLPRMSFLNETWQALRTLVVLCHHIFFNFLEFTIHGVIKRAKTRMCTFQHFFHECKWHWHIGDVFLSILVSYLHFLILY